MELNWEAFFKCLMVIIVVVLSGGFLVIINGLIFDCINNKRKKKITCWEYVRNIFHIILVVCAITCTVIIAKKEMSVEVPITANNVDYVNVTHNYD